ncbi:Transglutaminase-like enzyme, putative cysteine protease [Roseomonas rosea]|uniref:Transglutaminase-like enzyme, putative cysteine protease n=1 Tax=Muricoccus roseus TaxID=198092 RepID=A0A1M6KSR4_9PROT|nr:transglutaminase family protein [Roseomonas rosea]SHJ61963.1 Transglutaminase-like enzyme, putative cysteine protease [Roseomonas rosea]
MIYRVRHVTAYAYERPVEMATHLLHLLPRPLTRQRVLQASLTSDPLPTRREEGLDHFGNPTAWFYLDRPHTRFSVTADSLVEVTAPAAMPESTPPWEAIREAALRDPDVAEFLFPSPALPPVPAARDFFAPHFPPRRAAGAAMVEMIAHFRDNMAFRAGVTTVSTPVEEVLRRRAGVCQDFAHLMITGLRMLGIPARYVSGYIRTRPPPGGVRRVGADQSHAWVAAWLGAETGWVEMDPTNSLFVRDEHVVLGWGRDFGDVSPLLGVILGGGRHSVSVGVDMDEPAAVPG